MVLPTGLAVPSALTRTDPSRFRNSCDPYTYEIKKLWVLSTKHSHRTLPSHCSQVPPNEHLGLGSVPVVLAGHQTVPRSRTSSDRDGGEVEVLAAESKRPADVEPVKAQRRCSTILGQHRFSQRTWFLTAMIKCLAISNLEETAYFQFITQSVVVQRCHIALNLHSSVGERLQPTPEWSSCPSSPPLFSLSF